MTATVAATGTGPAAGPAIGATERSAADTSATLRRHGETLVVVLAGDWELARTAPRFGQLVPDGAALHPDGAAPQPDGAATHADAAATEPDGAATQPDGAATEPDGTHQPPIDAVEVDAAALGTWDSSLLTFLLQAMDHCEARDLEFREGNLPEEIVHLLELVRAVPEREMDPPPPAASFPARVGSQGLAFYRALLESVAFVGALTDSFVRLSLFRFRLRWRDFWVVVQANSSGALPIVTLIAFLVGMIISFLGAVVLRRFGAGYFVSYLVGYGMLREMAALMTGIIMAGRTGAAFAAELGSMKMTEEIDALRTLGISPVDHLLLPRVLGLGVTMPLLTIYAGFVGILGGMVVATSVLDLSVTQFMGGLLSAVTLPDALLGVFKGAVFGLIIGVAGCMKGMQTGGDAGAVGRAATSAVVLGITLIIGANALIDWLAVLLNV